MGRPRPLAPSLRVCWSIHAKLHRIRKKSILWAFYCLQLIPLPSDTPGGRVGLCRGQRPSFRGRCAGGWGDVTHYLAGYKQHD